MVEGDVAPLLLTGASGFLGRALLAALEGSHTVLSAHRTDACDALDPGRVPLDLLEPGWEARIAALAPRVVVHAAAVSDPDESERDPERARALNFEATARLARAVSGSCERFIYCSTDQVFDGERSLYRETDSPAPISQYGRTKLLGEEAARVLGPRTVVARLSLLFGGTRPGQASFLEKMLVDVRASRPVKLFVDQFRTPLHVEDAAAGIELLLRLEHAPAVVHLGGPERLSRYDVGLIASRVLGFDAELLLPARVADAPPLAPRPTDVSLDISLARSLGFAPRKLEEALRSIRAPS